MRITVLLLFIFFATSLPAQISTNGNEKNICGEILKKSQSENLNQLPINEVAAKIAKQFIGTNYEAGTLDQNEKEELVVHLSGLDCYTLVDNSIAFARAIKSGTPDYETFISELEKVRYRNGKLNGYISRLHYVTDWIYDLQKRGILKDITKEIGGEKFKKTINFMSENSEKYAHLINNADNVAKIKVVENGINSRDYYFVSQEKIADVETNINDGDIIALTTGIKGLDIVHVGFAVKGNDNRIHFLHAPNVGFKVQITEKTLADYVQGIKSQTGIMVFRVLEPGN